MFKWLIGLFRKLRLKFRSGLDSFVEKNIGFAIDAVEHFKEKFEDLDFHQYRDQVFSYIKQAIVVSFKTVPDNWIVILIAHAYEHIKAKNLK